MHDTSAIDDWIMIDYSDVSNTLAGATLNDKTTSEPQPLLEFASIISDHVDRLSTSLRKASLEIHDNPELRYKEFRAHDILTSLVEQQGSGWEVTRSAYGIATAFVAVYDSGRKGPVVSFNAEYGVTLSQTSTGCHRNKRPWS